MITSYLSSKIQRFKINQAIWKLRIIKTEVLQRSLLGLLLFTVYLSPIRTVFLKTCLDYQIYADNTMLYCSLSSDEGSIDKIQIDLNKFVDWFENVSVKIITRKKRKQK